jgi:putative ABC transport system substrate-binding protein
MKRREFITLIGGTAAWPMVARAQQHQSVVGILAPQLTAALERFERKLRDYGYIDGKNVRFLHRFADGHEERYPVMAAELVALPVDVIVTWGTTAALAAKQATSSIPVVMGAIADPVSVGIVANLARPNENITGFATQNVDLEGKRLELLKELVPHLSLVGVLVNGANPLTDSLLRVLRPTADQLHIELEIFDARGGGIASTLQRLSNTRPDGVLVGSDLLLLTERSEIAGFFAKNKLPAVYPFREYAEVGGLIIHGANLGVLFERAADYVVRILKGAKPADLPVQLATEFELIINLKTAKGMGLAVPPTLISRSDEVIE